MANKYRNFSDIAYSINIGSSEYHVFGHHKKNSKSSNVYFLAEDTAIRCKSVNDSKQSSVRRRRSKSRRQYNLIEHSSKTNSSHQMTSNSDVATIRKIEKTSSSTNSCHLNRTKSSCTSNKRIPSDITTVERTSSFMSNNSENKTIVRLESNLKTEDISRFLNEQKNSFIQVIEQQLHAMTEPITDKIKQNIIETLQKQQKHSMKELESKLTKIVQKELNMNKSQSNSHDYDMMTNLQKILSQTVENYLLSSIKNNNQILENFLVEQKELLRETVTQQQSIMSIDLVKQIISDAINEQYGSSILTNTTTYSKTNTKTINKEIYINADVEQTRVDAVFRQQRNTIVADRYLRDAIRQWSNIRTIPSLIQKISSYGTNDYENAWLLYCWIGQNIHYDKTCQNNDSVESFFENRKGLSQDFTNLYRHCCSMLNIQCLEISGYTKQKFLKKNDDLKNYLHSWNAIIIDKQKYLVDLTWGAGCVGIENDFEDFYFLTSPEQFIYTHYSIGHQLLQPELTEKEFLDLPVVTSNYYRLNLNLLSPKHGYNQTNENIFKISIQTPAYVDLFISLNVDDIEYPRNLHTLCQRDINQKDTLNCYIAPPADGIYDLVIHAKTNDEITYRDTIYMKLNISNLYQSITFPLLHPLFNEHKCILIEPFRRRVQENEQVIIHMKIPNANAIKIKNGDNFIPSNKIEYTNDVLKADIYVEGNIHIYARWDNKSEHMSIISTFHMM